MVKYIIPSLVFLYFIFLEDKEDTSMKEYSTKIELVNHSTNDVSFLVRSVGESEDKDLPLISTSVEIAQNSRPKKQLLHTSQSLQDFQKVLSDESTLAFIKGKILETENKFDAKLERERFLAVDLFKKAISWDENSLLEGYKNLAIDVITKDLSNVEDRKLKKSLLGDRIEMLFALEHFFDDDFIDYVPDLLKREFLRIKKVRSEI